MNFTKLCTTIIFLIILSNKVSGQEVLKPELLKFGASMEDLIISLTPLCDSIVEKKNEPIQLPTVVNTQSQLDCYGFMYAGDKRKVELIFADNYMDMIWILTGSDEEENFIKEFKNHFGEPTHIKSDATFFINNGAAVRNEPHEVMFISERLLEPYKQWLDNN
jgi:hypothetical protein